jgi:murein DD-endopeptidase
MLRTKHTVWLPLAMLAALLLTACAGGPRRTADASAADSSAGARIAASALAQLGRPYLYGGSGPASFDCSGLVSFAHAAHGILVPRTTAEQVRAARPVPVAQVQAGDVLFFRFDSGAKVSHVAIYTGNGRFVHAPQTGRPVESRQLDDPWYSRRLTGAGRFY